ncbi:hypothetical protein NPIL_477451 [Nephila pilipes]|uniref:Uncharacterized protein n=1 Tax=Nephila pilipes TaxID=299642 RepID=A0A8X6U8I5_NEPPI|nr:hypothetical protein NPIL_477451 [Nephila pilipes]
MVLVQGLSVYCHDEVRLEEACTTYDLRAKFCTVHDDFFKCPVPFPKMKVSPQKTRTLSESTNKREPIFSRMMFVKTERRTQRTPAPLENPMLVSRSAKSPMSDEAQSSH